MDPRTPLRSRILCVVALAAIAFAGCTEAREAPAPRPTWRTEIGPLVGTACVECHGVARAEGAYRLDGYPAALGGGSDATANAISGDAGSRLLTALQEPTHAGMLDEEERARLTAWVVDAELAFFDSLVHPAGFVNPADDAFHGLEIERGDWSLAPCATCHGEALAGSSAAPSCTDCHAGTPRACDTCHGGGGDPMPGKTVTADYAIGAHLAHVQSPKLGKPVACVECHVVPTVVDAPGHLDNDGHADVAFGPQAAARGATPTYDHQTGTCSNVACHGAGLENGTVPAPEWGGGGPVSICGSCHGVPPRGLDATNPHAQSGACELCHETAKAGPDGVPVIADLSLHMNGVLNVRDGMDRCDTCHAGPEAPLPFQDTAGRTDVSLRTVGAHEVHLRAGTYTDGYTCDVCHVVPKALGEDGHVDPSPAELALPGGGAFDVDRSTCTVKCHGVGMDGGPDESPSWTGPREGFLCGSCHAVPPLTTAAGELHPPDTNCAPCHGAVLDAQYQWVDLDKHANGTVEVVTP